MKKGFTLIELLVVISIISLLSSIVFASLGSARDKGRDTAKIAELKQAQLAFEQFRFQNNRFPLNRYNQITGANNSENPRSSLLPYISEFIPSINTWYYLNTDVGGNPDLQVAYEVGGDDPNTYGLWVPGSEFSDGLARCLNASGLFLKDEPNDCPQG